MDLQVAGGNVITYYNTTRTGKQSVKSENEEKVYTFMYIISHISFFKVDGYFFLELANDPVCVLSTSTRNLTARNAGTQ